MQNPHHERRWLVLAVLGIAQLMVVLDATIVNIALPSAQKALHFSNADRQWVVTAYALAFGSLLLLGGRISDLFGRKWTFVGGLTGFAIASALGGAASSLRRAHRRPRRPGRVRGHPRARLAVAAGDDVHRSQGARQGVWHLRRAGREWRGRRPAARRRAHEYLSWRWCLYVNLIFAGLGIAGALALPAQRAPEHRPRHRRARDRARLHRAVRARLRVLAREHDELEQQSDRSACSSPASCCSSAS